MLITKFKEFQNIVKKPKNMLKSMLIRAFRDKISNILRNPINIPSHDPAKSS